MKHPAFILVLLCAVFDFVFGYVKGGSVAAGAVGIVAGLPLTFLLLFVLSRRHKDEAKDSRL